MQTVEDTSLQSHLSFEYTSFDRVVLRGYIQSLFFAGSVISLLRNLGFKSYTNGVMRIFTDKLNSHIKKTAESLNVKIHWWGTDERKKYHSKIDLIKTLYPKLLGSKK